MKYLKRFNENQSEIDNICRQYGIKNYTIVAGLVDVEGDVDLNGSIIAELTFNTNDKRNLIELPFQFGKVSGNFYCYGNQLITLAGAPKEVGGSFHCQNNELTSLNGCPQEVGGNFYCNDNQLKSLTGCPKNVSSDFDCSRNKLTSLEGGPENVGGDFDCYNNRLTSLVSSPKRVGGEFVCNNNQIHSFLGLEIGTDFKCYNNPIEVIWNIFKGVRFYTPNKFPLFLDKIDLIYTDFQLGDGWTIQGEVLEQIAEELTVQLPTNWESQLVNAGYTII